MCPICGASVRILEAFASVIIYEDGVEQDSGFEWENDADAECTACDWKGAASEITEET